MKVRADGSWGYVASHLGEVCCMRCSRHLGWTSGEGYGVFCENCARNLDAVLEDAYRKQRYSSMVIVGRENEEIVLRRACQQ